ncbi:type II toxin-antitoxin system HicB family antitoxin [Microcoleus sp. S36b_A4]|uniref:type II toxin-antitoxin system HicB family antitoxin n=1 Tax=Microcoleus sp. S36b_A4 TaxID=3055420 RepID=UPI002FD4992F
MIDFYTVILKKSADYWVSLCLENGLVGQGNTPEKSIDKLKQAIESFSEVYESESDVYLSPLSINELHEFLTLEDAENSDSYELRKIYA